MGILIISAEHSLAFQPDIYKLYSGIGAAANQSFKCSYSHLEVCPIISYENIYVENGDRLQNEDITM